MATKPVSERRRFARAHTSQLIEILWRHFPAKPIVATLRDISRTGALIVTAVPIPFGERITIRPASKAGASGTEIDAVVCRRGSCDAGDVELGCRFAVPLDYSVVRPFY